MNKYDLVIIGGGPAGYIPAIRAAQLGRRVAVAEEELLGGTCLNRGCIPTKTLVASTTLLRQSMNARKYGLEGNLTFSWDALSRRKDTVVKRLRKGVEAHFKHLGIDVFNAHAVLKGPGEVLAGDALLETDHILLSPGSLPLMPGPFSADGVQTSRDVLSWDALPESLIIVGGGVIGCEFASIFASLGVEITIVEMLPTILPGIDDDIRQVVHRSLKRSGVKVLTGNAAKSLKVSKGSAEVTLEDTVQLSAAKILVSIGRKARTDDLGLESVGIEFSPAGIHTDENQMTNLKGVYAAGDVTGKWQLAHAGSAQALAAVDHMFGDGNRKINPDAMPGCIFTTPEIATVGPGQEEWKKRGVPVRTGISRYIANGKAVGMNETEGFVKIIARESDGIVIGVQMVGADASSLIGEAVMAVNLGAGASEIGEMIHPHPTLSELYMEAGESFGAGAIHG
ncbi:MAG: dihydrolipoyl dehydrogenase [Candidatus Aegiribacteria sp.]|nr:dihydrolipoyl dehydrogenase [Candidatus Aegiribacteria sp.]